MADSDNAGYGEIPYDEHSEAAPYEPLGAAPVADRRRAAGEADWPQEGSGAAKIIAQRRKMRKIPWILASVLLVTNIVQPVFYMHALSSRREVVLMDGDSNLLVSPFLEPMQSDKVQEVCFTWASKGFLDRTPGGFANPLLLESYFTQGAREKAQADWLAQEVQAKSKEIFQDYAPFRFQVQSREGNRLRVRVDGQLRVQARDNGLLVTEPRSVAIELTFSSNPNMGSNRFFPLIVEQWRYLADPLPLPGA